MSIIEKANEYIEWDLNEETRNQVINLIERNDLITLEKILSYRLQFGTAGLRGPMGPGYNCMNELVILQTCQGLAVYLEESLGLSSRDQGIVIGYDHRKLGSISSLSIARVSAAVFLHRGFKVYLLENFVPTPFVAFGVKYFKAAAGIMVTASHNPKRDNGFKVYWNNGCQIIPPHDSGIAEKIQSNLRPWTTYDTESVLHNTLVRVSTDEVADAYYIALKRLLFTPLSRSHLTVTYTAMHGVGKKWLLRAFESYGHALPSLVESQCEPDPNFPTVTFPNPEEKGALDLAMNHAESIGSSVIIANDPDADRLALAERLHVPSKDSQMNWHVFSGNEIGILLGHYQIMRWKLRRAIGLTVRSNAAVLTTVVSSRMLRAIATTEGLVYRDTLTGFKWIGNKAVQLAESSDPVDVVFSYEEALGYCVGDAVADKDGISAAVSLVEFAHSVYEGKLPGVSSIYEYLLSLYSIYGQFVSYNGYYFCYDPKTTDIIFTALRHRNIGSSEETDYGRAYAGVDILSIKDVTLGYDSTTVDHVLDLPKTPDSQMIMYEFANGCSLTLRTSGTEPKIKYYTEMQGESTVDVNLLREKLISFVEAAVDEMLQPTKNNLTKP